MLVVEDITLAFSSCPNSKIADKLKFSPFVQEYKKMSKNEQQKFFVSPLGRFGHTYEIDRRTHTLYRRCLMEFLVAMFAVGEFNIFAQKFFISWSISDNVFYAFIIVMFFAGMGSLLKIASLGRIIQESIDNNSETLRNISRVEKGLGHKLLFMLICLLTVTVAALFGGSIYFRIINNNASARQVFDAVVLVALFGYAAIKFYHKSRKN